MKFELKGGDLVITLPLDKKGKPSKTGKTNVHASTKGNVKTEVEVNGQKLVVGVNAYTPVD